MSISFDFEDGLPPMNIDVIRSEKNIVIMEVEDLKMKTISWGAKGLYAYIKSFPDAFSYKHLFDASMEEKDVVKGYVQELLDVNFLNMDA